MRKQLRFFSLFGQDDELEKNYMILGIQFVSIVTLIFTFIFWFIFELFWPGFFNFKGYWYKTNNLFGSILSYWPLFAWGGILALVSGFNVSSHFKAKAILATDIAKSVLAGVWEELGYRCVFIFIAMISIFISNFIWHWLIIALLVIICIAIVTHLRLLLPKVIIVAVFLAMAIGFYFLELKDPIYWMYSHIIFPVFDFVSFHTLAPILYNKSLPFLFIAGAVSANSNFKDGRKYQGPIGMLNAWIIGFVFLHIMIFHGLIVAIICHAIYDLEFAFIRFGFREVKNGLE